MKAVVRCFVRLMLIASIGAGSGLAQQTPPEKHVKDQSRTTANLCICQPLMPRAKTKPQNVFPLP
jgi:hypothetical protein